MQLVSDRAGPAICHLNNSHAYNTSDQKLQPEGQPGLGQSPRSISRIHVSIEVSNRGVADCELVRHMAPLTVSSILKGLPVQDRVHMFADQFKYIETGLVIGAEKQKSQFRRGDIAFMVSSGSVCVFVKDSSVSPMNPIGTVLSNLEAIESSRTGDVLILKRKESP